VLGPVVTAWRDSGLYPGLVAAAQVPPDGPVDEQAVARVAIAGDADECARGLAALAGAGATSVVLLPVGDDRDGQLEALGRDVLPLVRPVRDPRLAAGNLD
jgi:alkanesulfonate monooxygenase SsuD/methylene tetrahydromethanopterin reductase-like flavin-dependent oxidoreductase (luciferase family)